MSRCSRPLDIALRKAHGLIGKALKPQNPRKNSARQHPLVVLKADCVRPVGRGCVICQHALGVVSRRSMISHVVEADADQAVTNQAIVYISCECSESLGPL